MGHFSFSDAPEIGLLYGSERANVSRGANLRILLAQPFTASFCLLVLLDFIYFLNPFSPTPWKGGVGGKSVCKLCFLWPTALSSDFPDWVRIPERAGGDEAETVWTKVFASCPRKLKRIVCEKRYLLSRVVPPQMTVLVFKYLVQIHPQK